MEDWLSKPGETCEGCTATDTRVRQRHVEELARRYAAEVQRDGENMATSVREALASVDDRVRRGFAEELYGKVDGTRYEEPEGYADVEGHLRHLKGELESGDMLWFPLEMISEMVRPYIASKASSIG
ncbi:hypothetical protein IAT38_000066 [Cryptococcus sp. DSM 104549]